MLSLFLLRKILFWFSAGAKPRREYKGSLPIYPNIPPKIPHPTHKLCYRPKETWFMMNTRASERRNA